MRLPYRFSVGLPTAPRGPGCVSRVPGRAPCLPSGVGYWSWGIVGSLSVAARRPGDRQRGWPPANGSPFGRFLSLCASERPKVVAFTNRSVTRPPLLALVRPRPLQRLDQIRRQRGAELHLLAAERMREPQSRAVQELAPQPMAPRVAVLRIPGHRVADRGEMGADLVGAAGLEPGLDERVRGQRLEDREVRARLPRAPAANGAACRRAVVAAERGIDRARARARPALDQRQVGAADLATLDLGGEAPMGLVAARDQHQPRRVLVQAMDDPRTLGILSASEQLAQHVDERVPSMPGGGVYDQSGGLVHHRQPLVGVDDPRPGGHPGPGFGFASSPAGAGLSETSTRPSAPSVIATSARLNAGHSGGSMKSVTASIRTRSARLPIAPPARSPTASHSPGRVGSSANHMTTRARATTVTASTNPSPWPIPNASPEFGVLVRRTPSAIVSWSPTESEETTTAFETWSRSTMAPQTRSTRRQAATAGPLRRDGLTRR